MLIDPEYQLRHQPADARVDLVQRRVHADDLCESGQGIRREFCDLRERRVRQPAVSPSEVSQHVLHRPAAGQPRLQQLGLASCDHRDEKTRVRSGVANMKFFERRRF